jgi:dephospho-CoA kinase
VTRVIGLTGGIGSGKSAVAAIFRELGAPVIDADQVARDVVEPGQPALGELVAAFGEGILGAGGALDRKRLGAIVFADPAARKRLDAITHPRIAAETARRIAALAASGAELVLYEAALLVENGMHRGLGGLIVVSAPPEVQRARVMARDGLSADEANARLAAQLPLADKVAAATHVVDNGGSLEATRRQVESIWEKIRGA